MPAHIVTCRACKMGNRVPSEREGVPGRCGNCGAQLPALHTRPVPLDDRTFDDFVRSYGGPVLAEFWAPW